jgi:hypothetical protein
MHVYYRKEWVNCRGWKLWKACSLEEKLIKKEKIVSVSTLWRENTTIEWEKNIEMNGLLYHDVFSQDVTKTLLDRGSVKFDRKIWSFPRTYVVSNDYAQCDSINSLVRKDFRDDFVSVLADIEGTKNWPLIEWLEKIGIIQWTLGWYFEWERNISRAEFLKIVLKTHCYDYQSVDVWILDFVDVDIESWQARVIALGVKKEIIIWDINEQWEKVFRPDDIISKIEATKILLRMWLIQNYEGESLDHWDEFQEWQKKYVYQWEYLDIFSARDSDYIFNALWWVSRNDMVEYLYKTIRLYR